MFNSSGGGGTGGCGSDGGVVFGVVLKGINLVFYLNFNVKIFTFVFVYVLLRRGFFVIVVRVFLFISYNRGFF